MIILYIYRAILTQTNPKKGLVEKKTDHSSKIIVFHAKILRLLLLITFHLLERHPKTPPTAPSSTPPSTSSPANTNRPGSSFPSTTTATPPTPTTTPSASSKTSWSSSSSSCATRSERRQLSTTRSRRRCGAPSTSLWRGLWRRRRVRSGSRCGWRSCTRNSEATRHSWPAAAARSARSWQPRSAALSMSICSCWTSWTRSTLLRLAS